MNRRPVDPVNAAVDAPVGGPSVPADQDGVFRALADPTRRLVLDALFAADGQTVVELCAVAPAMTRFGVMKHLRVLEEANLVASVRSGRTKRHYLNPVPIAQIADRWIGKYAAPYASALLDLAREVAGTPTQDSRRQ